MKLFNFIKKQDIKEIEERIAKLEQKQRCEKDYHVWGMFYRAINRSLNDPNKPYIACKHCYKEFEY